jgi:Domain of unknown function (DUF4440)
LTIFRSGFTIADGEEARGFHLGLLSNLVRGNGMSKAALLVALAIASFAFWQDEEKPPDQEVQRQEILNLENETARAMQLNNSTFFKRVYSEDFQGTTSRGQVVSKAQLIQFVEGSQLKYDLFQIKEGKVRIFGNTAVFTGLWIQQGRFLGQQINAHVRVLHVYVNGRRGWQAIAGEETLVL